MKKAIVFLVFCFGLIDPGFAISISDSEIPMKSGFFIKQMDSKTGMLTYGVEYPVGFNPKKKYPILLCLPGGDFAPKLATYYNWVYTPTKLFKDHIKIYAITNKENSVLNFKYSDWRAFIEAVQENENGNDSDWVISGASNGGIAIFNIISARPDLFRGFIAIPGRLNGQKLLKEWKNYDALMVYGTEDKNWIKPTLNTYNKLKGHVRAIDLIALDGEGHVLPYDYDINPIYQAFEDLTP